MLGNLPPTPYIVLNCLFYKVTVVGGNKPPPTKQPIYPSPSPKIPLLRGQREKIPHRKALSIRSVRIRYIESSPYRIAHPIN